jgi:hypothetical protein
MLIEASGLLRNARARIVRGWCQHASARDGDGRIVEPWDDSARSWSLLGAVVAVTEPKRLERGDLSIDELRRALGALAQLIPDPSLEHWNDERGRTAADVLDVLDRATTIADGGAARGDQSTSAATASSRPR